MNHVSLFTGSGIPCRVAQKAGFRTVAMCEHDPACQFVLRKLWPQALLFEDVATADWSLVTDPVDLLDGGVPCQPISTAGKQLGDKDERWLWPATIRAVRGLRPTWLLFENPGNIVRHGLERIVAELETLGYDFLPKDEQGDFTPLVIGAWAVGAPHKRERVWIVAHRTGGGQPGDGAPRGSGGHADERGAIVPDASPYGCGSGRQRPQSLDSTQRPLPRPESAGGGDGPGNGELGDTPRIGEREPHDPPIPQPRKRTRKAAGGTSPGKQLDDSPSTGEEATQQPGQRPCPLGASPELADADCQGREIDPGITANDGSQCAATVGGCGIGRLADGPRKSRQQRAERDGAGVGGESGSRLADAAILAGDGGQSQPQRGPQRGTPLRWPSRPGQPQYEWESARTVDYRGLHPSLRRFLGQDHPALVACQAAAAAQQKTVDATARRAIAEFIRPMGKPVDGLGSGLRGPALHGPGRVPLRALSRANKEMLKLLGNGWVQPVAQIIVDWIAGELQHDR